MRAAGPYLSRVVTCTVEGAGVGALRTLTSADGSIVGYISRLVRTQNLQATTIESQGIPAAGAEAAVVKTFGDMPLIVLTAKLNNMPGWQEWQTELLQLSSNNQPLFAENSVHNIEIEEPEAAVGAIIQMVHQIQQALKVGFMLRKIAFVRLLILA